MPERAAARPVVLAAPSGAGKTTIARRLVEEGGPFVFSISATTRAPRSGERHGRDYLFVDEPRFRAMVSRGEFAEWAEVHGRLYGTPLRNLDEASRAGRFPILDIDVQGARQIRERRPGALLVFVLPPSTSVWMGRLWGRGTEPRANLQLRLRAAARELDDAVDFDLVVVNDDLDEAVAQVREAALGAGTGLEPAEVRRRVDELKEGLAEALDRLGDGEGRTERGTPAHRGADSHD